MISIKNLTMKNFLSVGAVTLALNLDKHGLTLVLGANTDTAGGLTRNGAGKTTVLQAISFALYGKPLSKIKIPNLINNVNNKQMLVTIEFSRGDQNYRIERGRKPDVMKFYVNNHEVKDEEPVGGEQQGENRHTQEEIERIIGMSHTMFKHIVALNTYTDPFLRMPVSNQREVIEELLGVTQISTRAEVLKKLIGQTKETMRDEQAGLKATIEANTRIENAIVQAETLSTAWLTEHETTITVLGEEITAMKDIDYEAEIVKFDAIDAWTTKEKEIHGGFDAASREISLLTREISALESEASRLTKDAHTDISAQVRRFESEKARKEKDIANMRGDVETKKAELVKLRSDIELSGKLECFCCGQELEGTDHLETVLGKMHRDVGLREKSIADFQAAIEELTAEVAHIDEEIEHVTTAAETRRVDFEAKAKAKLDATKEPKGRLTAQEALASSFGGLMKTLGDRPEALFSTRDEVYRAKQLFDKLVREVELESAKENPHANQIETFRATLQTVDYTSINDLDDLHKHQDFLLRLLTNKDSFIRKKIIDQNLNYLNSRLNHYLEKLGLPHEVRFQSDLSVDITLLGRDFDFEQLSRGEMNRVIMATSWSFRDVWESLNEGFNLLFVDEMLDQGTDAQGVEAALSILKSMARDRNKNVFLISHRDDLTARIDRILLVRKENGFTRFEEDALV
jgi:DNA repair exonuclease SbcCD ATPase subunit